MRRYEVVYISQDDLSDDEFEVQLERYKSIIADMGGTVVKVDKWGKRRLAYPIKKRRDGVYVLIDFVGESKIVSELERNFRIDDKILRFISVKTNDKVDPEEIEREIAQEREAKTAEEVSEKAEAVQEQKVPEAAPEELQETASEESVSQPAGESVEEPVEEAKETEEK